MPPITARTIQPLHNLPLHFTRFSCEFNLSLNKTETKSKHNYLLVLLPVFFPPPSLPFSRQLYTLSFCLTCLILSASHSLLPQAVLKTLGDSV